MKIPLLDLHRQYAPIRADVLAAVTRVCDSQQFIMGPEVVGLEHEIATHVGAAHGIGISSGTDALLVALMASGIGAGDEVIVPTFSFFATAGVVSRLGATPVFVDVEPGTLTIDPAAARAAVTPRTRAIIPVHLYGLCADMDPIMALAAEHQLVVIEDAAQAIGATYHGRQAGTLGHVGCFSFFPTKNLGGGGDGGFVTTNDEALATHITRLRNHGAEQRYYHREVGGNFRLDALQAAILRVKLPHLAQWNTQRQANAATYHRLFASALGDRVCLPPEPADRTHVFHQYVIRLEPRDRVREQLAARGIGSEVYYPVPFHRQECFAALPSASRAYPVADAAAASVLALPIYPELTTTELEQVVEAIVECVR